MNRRHHRIRTTPRAGVGSVDRAAAPAFAPGLNAKKIKIMMLVMIIARLLKRRRKLLR